MDSASLLQIMLPAFCECLVLVGIHSYLGIHVIQRKVIFVDLAFAQIAALGSLVALLFGIPLHTPTSAGFSLFLTAMGAGIFSLSRFRSSRIPQEAVIGLVYAIAAAGAILLIDKAPHGAEHLKEIFTGSILWVQWHSIRTAVLVYSAVGLFHYLARKKLLLISRDPDAAYEAGINVRLWDFLFYLSFGVVITVSVDVAGVLIVFVFLVAPAILALLITQRVLFQLLVGWGLGVLVTAAGLVLAYVADLSTGPAVIATYALAMLIVAAAVHVARAPRKGAAAARVALVAGAFAAAIGVLLFAGSRLGGATAAEEEAAHGRADSQPEASAPPDPVQQADRIVETLARDPDHGRELAVAFLETAPPPFCAAQVLEKLRGVLGTDPGYDASQPPTSPENKAALARILQGRAGK